MMTTGHADDQELSLVRAVDSARAATRTAHKALQSARRAEDAVYRAALAAGDVVPSWAKTALSATARAADAEHDEARRHEAAMLRALNDHIAGRLAAASASARAIVTEG